MAGISKTRVDYGDKGSVTKTDDKQSGAQPQEKSIPQPTRAQRPVADSENRATFDKSQADPATRPTTSQK